jgi:hypothetical protein
MRCKTLFAFVAALALFSLVAGTGFAQDILYEEHFTGGVAALNWESAFTDSLGSPLTPMQVDSIPHNPSGDGWVGIVEADTASLGGLGCAWVNDTTLTDYSMEAQIYVDVDGEDSYYEGIMVRIDQDTTTGVVRGYQLVSNFYPPFFISKLRFRKYSSNPDDIVVLQDYSGTDIPGGAPTTSGWHTFKIDVQGDLFYLYWDDQELPGNPQIDTTSTPLPARGGFGVYCFNITAYTRVLSDDIVVEGPPPQGVGDTPGGVGLPRAFNLSQNYPNPFNPMTTIRVDIPEGTAVQSTLIIYDLRGHKVRTLVDKPLSAGTHLIAWDGRDDSGRQAPSGTYIYRMKRGQEQYTRKMLLMK